MSAIKDINNKFSSKRTIALISFAFSILLTIGLIFYDLGNIKLIGMFLGASLGESFACLCERKH